MDKWIKYILTNSVTYYIIKSEDSQGEKENGKKRSSLRRPCWPGLGRSSHRDFQACCRCRLQEHGPVSDRFCGLARQTRNQGHEVPQDRGCIVKDAPRHQDDDYYAGPIGFGIVLFLTVITWGSVAVHAFS